jgi:hypothetical protein
MTDSQIDATGVMPLDEPGPFDMSVVDGHCFLLEGLRMAAEAAVECAPTEGHKTILRAAVKAFGTTIDAAIAHYSDTNFSEALPISAELLGITMVHFDDIIGDEDGQTFYHLGAEGGESVRNMMDDAKPMVFK